MHSEPEPEPSEPESCESETCEHVIRDLVPVSEVPIDCVLATDDIDTCGPVTPKTCDPVL